MRRTLLIALTAAALFAHTVVQAQTARPRPVKAALARAKPKPKPTPTVSDMPSGPKAYVGTYTIGKDGEGAEVCTIHLNAPGVIGGFQLVVPKGCRKAVAGWEDLYAWYVNTKGDLVMADATRKAVYVFHRLDDVWATDGGDWERLLLWPEHDVGVQR